MESEVGIMESPTDTDPVDRTTAAWRVAGERADADGAGRCLAEGIEVISPLTAGFRFRGRGQAQDMLSAAFEVVSEIRFHTETGTDSTRALFYHGRCGRERFEEAQLLRFDPDGLIVELTLFGRPLPGLTAVMAAIGPALLRRQARPTRARAIGAATAPLATMTRLGERHLVPLVDPGRR
ncbi:MAG: nuclear transport factor 2 family protein [Pseudonocardiaceae bacterium]|nr:nuclear transport factor 2 family protein [Pseudonocardiaceae bacterium]